MKNLGHLAFKEGKIKYTKQIDPDSTRSIPLPFHHAGGVEARRVFVDRSTSWNNMSIVWNGFPAFWGEDSFTAFWEDETSYWGREEAFWGNE